MTVAAPETSSHVTIFAAEWCPFCRKLRERLDRTAVSYTHLTLPTIYSV